MLVCSNTGLSNFRVDISQSSKCQKLSMRIDICIRKVGYPFK